jgi:hypothetical protein
MRLILEIPKIKNHHVQYYEPILNTVLPDSTFVRTGYSNACFNTNDICVEVELYITKVEKYYNKHKYILDYSKNVKAINHLIHLEQLILSPMDIESVHKIYKLKQQLDEGVVYLYGIEDTSIAYNQRGTRTFTIKISGIWISQTTMALTYKYILNSYPSVEKK